MLIGFGEIAKLIFSLNDEGRKIAIECLRDVASRQKYLNDEPETVDPLDKAVALGNSWRRYVK